MRLLQTAKFTLHEFYGDEIPNYAILSHRWEEEEVSFKDLQEGRATSMKGFSKILGCCKQALLDGWKYAWVDSCCIDKTSSAELSEAINSMFKWYQDSKACYVYLSDVPTASISSHHAAQSSFLESKWFTRGWTLQELIAPLNVIFYDCEWKEIGTKRSMGPLLSKAAGIDRLHLFDFTTASVAQKMSWASKRKTTRLEDLAYSLLGIFDVHMPPLYGEGPNAFLRLQLEILASTDDESLLAWQPIGHAPTTGLLAPYPAAFRYSGDIIVSKVDKNRPPFAMTSKGLRLEMFLLERDTKPLSSRVPLNCSRRNGDNISLLLFSKAEVNKDSTNVEYLRHGLLAWGDIKELNRDPEKPHVELSVEKVALEKFKVTSRTVMFFRQGSRSYAEERFHNDLPVSFAINTVSLLEHGITTFEEATDGSEFRSFKTRDLWRFGEGQESERVVFGRADWVAYLRFAPSIVDTFILVVYTNWRYWKTPSVKILTAEEDKPADELSKILYDDEEWIFRSDRVSKVLGSGKSVSVALRNKFEAEQLEFVLDVTIDVEGKLLWPVN